jgi:hypothetical protein
MLVERIAVRPRFAGTDAEEVIRAECESRLRELGFDVQRESFSYSRFPAQVGPTLCALVFAAGMFLAGHLASAHGRPGLGLITIAIAATATLAMARYLIRHVLSFPAMRAMSTNLIAARGDSSPGVWLVAHIDSKSQTIRMLIRVASVGATWIFLTVTIVTMVMAMTGLPVAMGFPDDVFASLAGLAAALTAFAILPVAFCFVTNRSRGALDNATGIASTLMALENIPADRGLGVLLTSAEELALAGARAFLASHEIRGIAINCDTIDDRGRFVCMTQNRNSNGVRAVSGAAKSHGVNVQVRGMIRGILTDSIPFAEAGWDTCTISRGNLGTLALVHTSRDVPERIDGTGVALAAQLLAATIEELS